MNGPGRLGLVGPGRTDRFHAVNLAGRFPGTRLARVANAAEALPRQNALLRLGGGALSTRHGDMLEDPDIEAVIDAAERSPRSRRRTAPETDSRGGAHG